jgi:hypothetical protein
VEDQQVAADHERLGGELEAFLGDELGGRRGEDRVERLRAGAERDPDR